MSLRERSRAAELMDAPDLDPATYARCLKDLAAVNRLTLTHRPILHWLDRATRGLPPATPLRLLDVASGHGDLLRAIWRWADRAGRPLRLEGLDLNPRSAVAAAEATSAEAAIIWRTGDVFDHAPAQKPDFIVSSQFTHHLGDDDVVRFLRWIDAHAARGWFIADLHRHPIAYHGFPLLARLAQWQPIVRHDGAVSVARGFTRGEWRRLLEGAGVRAEIAWHPLFRHGVSQLR